MKSCSASHAMHVNPRMDGWKPHRCGWVYLSAAIPCPRNVCMFARLRCDAGRCQDVCLVPIPCVLASHGLEVLGETIAPIVPHKIPDCWHCSRRQHWCILWAVGAGRGSRESTIAFCHGGAGQGPYDQGQSWMSRCRFKTSLSLHLVPRAATTQRPWSSTQNYTLFYSTRQLIANIVQFHVCGLSSNVCWTFSLCSQ